MTVDLRSMIIWVPRIQVCLVWSRCKISVIIRAIKFYYLLLLLYDRGSAHHDRGSKLYNRGSELHNRGPALPDYGTALPDCGSALHDRGSALHDRGSNFVADFFLGYPQLRCSLQYRYVF